MSTRQEQKQRWHYQKKGAVKAHPGMQGLITQCQVKAARLRGLWYWKRGWGRQGRMDRLSTEHFYGGEATLGYAVMMQNKWYLLINTYLCIYLFRRQCDRRQDREKERGGGRQRENMIFHLSHQWRLSQANTWVPGPKRLSHHWLPS